MEEDDGMIILHYYLYYFIMRQEVLSPDAERHLIAIENSLRDESQQIEKMRRKIENISRKCLGSLSRQVPTGLPICGIIEYLDAPKICLRNGKYVDQNKDCTTTHLVCEIIFLVDISGNPYWGWDRWVRQKTQKT